MYPILVNLDFVRSFNQSTYDESRHKHPLVFAHYKCRVVTIFAKSYFSNYLFIKDGNSLLFSLSIYLSIYLLLFVFSSPDVIVTLIHIYYQKRRTVKAN